MFSLDPFRIGTGVEHIIERVDCLTQANCLVAKRDEFIFKIIMRYRLFHIVISAQTKLPSG